MVNANRKQGGAYRVGHAECGPYSSSHLRRWAEASSLLRPPESPPRMRPPIPTAFQRLPGVVARRRPMVGGPVRPEGRRARTLEKAPTSASGDVRYHAQCRLHGYSSPSGARTSGRLARPRGGGVDVQNAAARTRGEAPRSRATQVRSAAGEARRATSQRARGTATARVAAFRAARCSSRDRYPAAGSCPSAAGLRASAAAGLRATALAAAACPFPQLGPGCGDLRRLRMTCRCG